MKFRILSGLLVITIIVLFSLVVKKSYDLKESQLNLLKSNEDLELLNEDLTKQRDTIAALNEVIEEQLATLKRATDSISFDVARKSNSFKSYRNYINTFGDKGEYYIKALTNLNSFFPKKGYVQLKESDGRALYVKFQDTMGFPKKPVMILNEPSVTRGNLYISKEARNVRRGVIGNPEFSNTSTNGDVIWVDQLVKVLDIIESGSSKWAHIAYGNR